MICFDHQSSICLRMKIRTFVAVAIPESIRAKALAAAERLAAVAPEVKWVEPASLHWTLNFLGNVDQREVGEICAAVADGVLGHEAFELEVRGAGAFPSPDRPRTLWLGVGEGRDAIIALQASIEKALEPLGFRGEARRYTPHLTIGRPGRGEPTQALADELAAMADITIGKMFVDEVTVYSSELTRQGPVYDPLGFAPLGEG
jgi:2'-5' RNA ligase